MVLTFFIVISFLIQTGLSCPTGWLRHDNTCYHFSHDTEPWTGAMDMCRVVGGTLLEIETAAENLYLTAQIKLLNQWYWIGLTDVQEENTWVWANSHKKLENGAFSNWNPNEPNNYGNDENCVGIKVDGMWNDGKCTNVGHYICEVKNE